MSKGFTLIELPAVRKGKCEAFTLIELLVVVAIIGALLALLAPVFPQSVMRSEMVICQSNLHQLGLASTAYLGEHRMRFMPFRYWIKGNSYTDMNGIRTGLIYPYIENVHFFLCPTFKAVCDPAAVRSYVMTWNFGCWETYWFNGDWAQPDSIDTLAQVKYPERLGIITEEATWKIPGYSTYTMNDAHLVAPDWPRRDTMSNFHYPGPGNIVTQIEGVANVVYIDGHVSNNTTDKTPYVLTQKWYD